MQSASLIDLATLPPDVRSNIEWTIRLAEEKQASDRKWDALLRDGTDAEIMAAAEVEFEPGTPITLADRYDHVPLHCEVRGLWTRYHPRRPVIQRGAKWARIAAHGYTHHLSANGYCVALFYRAIRLSKRTILDDDEYQEFARSLREKILSRYRTTSTFDKYTSEHVGKRNWGSGEHYALIGGKFVTLNCSEWENIRALNNIIKKTDKLDRRIASARAHFRERMAA